MAYTISAALGHNVSGIGLTPCFDAVLVLQASEKVTKLTHVGREVQRQARRDPRAPRHSRILLPPIAGSVSLILIVFQTQAKAA